jgi:U3 small nucleolar ribonucleoprotein protein LCP5
LSSELIGELATSQEIMDKVRGMETKLEYQIKKLTALVDAEQAKGAELIEDAEEGEWRKGRRETYTDDIIRSAVLPT